MLHPNSTAFLSRPTALSFMPKWNKAKTSFIGCLASGACALATSLPAQALTFNWSWSLTDGGPTSETGTVSGTVSGLLSNTPNQTSITATVTSAPNTPPGGWTNDWSYDALGAGNGLSVDANNNVTGTISFRNSKNDLLLLSTGGDYPTLVSENGLYINSNYAIPSNISFDLVPDPSPVPGPLPLLGAAAAFGWSRRIRRRLKAGTTTA